MTSSALRRPALLATVLTIALPMASFAAPPTTAAPAGQAAPVLHWTDLDGAPASLAQWRGRPVLLNYWASWCGPCLKELPDLQDFSQAQTSRPNGVHVVGVALDDVESAKALRDQLRLTYPQLVEGDGPPGTAAAFGNRIGTLPFSVLIDAHGTVLQVHNGPLHPADLARWAAAAGGAP
ncbi:TlpA disulfide reductase family protein [Stenotrophomonas sp. Ste96]|jgi:thiol-disulfide isomerase/thioredoxin|uniref:TlpA family protein disulfide reductase n=1 Tax=Stenotrophomonas sp. Ste96 TaxID=2926029 RepID=UPI0021C98E33|nr:TlpA disulfide reductase family protein [Stenotrophomonas sp. Ste96]